MLRRWFFANFYLYGHTEALNYQWNLPLSVAAVYTLTHNQNLTTKQNNHVSKIILLNLHQSYATAPWEAVNREVQCKLEVKTHTEALSTS